jgi:hypothetical protein
MGSILEKFSRAKIIKWVTTTLGNQKPDARWWAGLMSPDLTLVKKCMFHVRGHASRNHRNRSLRIL